MSFATLETERLIIREYTLGDLHARHRINSAAFGSDAPLDSSRQWLEWTVRNYRELANLHQPPYGDYAVTLRASGEVVGSIGLVPSTIPWGVLPDHRPPDEAPSTFSQPEYGLFWAIAPEQWGHGFAPEAGRAFIGYVFDRLHPRRVVATTEHNNHKSQRVMAKLGMTLARNPTKEPFWLEVVGVLDNPAWLAIKY